MYSKKNILFIALTATAVLVTSAYLYIREGEVRHTIQYSDEEIRYVLSKIKPSPVVCEIMENCSLYTELDSNSPVQTVLKKGAQVEIIQDRTALWYKILDYGTDKIGWVEGRYLAIPPEIPVNTEELPQEIIEAFVNIMEFESQTDYFVWTDIDRQKTYILKGRKGAWEFVKSMTCSTGVNQSPTTRGSFKITDRGEWFYSERLKSGGKYWVKFNGSYLFHSPAMDKSEKITDGVLGERRSSGCVRMGIEDIKWFYKNIGYGTGVFIY